MCVESRTRPDYHFMVSEQDSCAVQKLFSQEVPAPNPHAFLKHLHTSSLPPAEWAGLSVVQALAHLLKRYLVQIANQLCSRQHGVVLEYKEDKYN